MDVGKVAVITGATSGIGRAAAIGLGKAGYRVAILGRRQDKLDAVAAESGAAFARTCDVTDADAVAGYFAALREALGRIDVVFNNAGQSSPAALVGDIAIDTWKNIVDTNLNGAF